MQQGIEYEKEMGIGEKSIYISKQVVSEVIFQLHIGHCVIYGHVYFISAVRE